MKLTPGYHFDKIPWFPATNVSFFWTIQCNTLHHTVSYRTLREKETISHPTMLIMQVDMVMSSLLFSPLLSHCLIQLLYIICLLLFICFFINLSFYWFFYLYICLLVNSRMLSNKFCRMPTVIRFTEKMSLILTLFGNVMK